MTPGWADPHPDRRPTAEEYSRCLDPGKYGILEARAEAWTQVLAALGLATTHDVSPHDRAWVGAMRDPSQWLRVRQVDPARPEGLTLLLATTLVDGAPYGLDVGLVGRNGMAAFLDTLPDCGCDACDSGSAGLLETMDNWVLTVARGGVVHARDATRSATRHWDGLRASGSGDPRQPARQWLTETYDWLDPSLDLPDGVQRWDGEPWL